MPAVDITDLTHAYGDRVALSDVSLSVESGEIFGLLGPNGSGKTTLFRILSTLVPTAPGHVRLFETDIATGRDAVRRLIGVVFQSPSLDKQLSAEENLVHQGHLYGLRGPELRTRVSEALASFGLEQRARERVATFSGGMRRRVEVAKALLHRPRLLLMDEPSTGLDPTARIELWRVLRDVSRRDSVTVMVTTHLMEEADRCDRLAILAQGKLLACDTPAALKERIGGDVITITTHDATAARDALRRSLSVEPTEVEGSLRLQRARAHEFVPQLVEAAPGLIDAISVGKPSLEDVFIQLTGQRFASDLASSEEALPPARSRR